MCDYVKDDHTYTYTYTYTYTNTYTYAYAYTYDDMEKKELVNLKFLIKLANLMDLVIL